MEIPVIVEKIKTGTSEFIQDQHELMERNLGEPLLSGKLFGYFEPLFPEFNVDPEYNGDIDKPNDRKALDIARNRIEDVKKEVNDKNKYYLKPDIIIHIRGTNKNNLAVIEVKKDNSDPNKVRYDEIKLEHLTINYLGNHYNYKIGVLIILGTGKNTGKVDYRMYVEGLPYIA